MKRYALGLTLFLAVFLTYCSSSRKASMAAKNMAPLSFATDVQPILKASCTPCHYNESGKRAFFGNTEIVKKQIDDILRRVQLPTDHKEFMPFQMKKPALSDSAITALKRWKETGLMD